jgi:hypothetical protein
MDTTNIHNTPSEEDIKKLYIFTDVYDPLDNSNNIIDIKNVNPHLIGLIGEPGPYVKHWGSYTWELFHVLANKIKPELFFIVKDKLIEYIVSICSNIFCQSCREHSIYYLQNNPFTDICCKEDLQLKLFVFHNNVTERRNEIRKSNPTRNKEPIPLFLISDLKPTYDKMKLIDVLDEFIKNDLILRDKQLYLSFKEWIYSVLIFFDE